MADHQLLPIKVVFKQDRDNSRRPPSPQKRKIFGEVTPELRERLARQVEAVALHFAPTFAKWPNLPAIAKVELKDEAVAKTHRPDFLFQSDTCPIVGGDRLGKIFVSVGPTGLAELAKRIRTSEHKEALPDISTLTNIQAYTAEDALRGRPLSELQEHCRSNAQEPLKFRLFRHGNADVDAAMRNAMLEHCRGLVEDIEELAYARSLTVYALHGAKPESIASLASFVGAQSLSEFPVYRLVRNASRVVGNVTATAFPTPDPTVDYGIVGMIDSGTDPNNPYLQAWVADRLEHVPASQQLNEHGSFVAGLLIHGRLLNHNHPRFPSGSVRIVDVVAIDKDGRIRETELRWIIEDAIAKFPAVRIWNMSLAMDGNTCRDDDFSEFGAFLDAMSRRHKVLFHIPAGNYVGSPTRSWRPQPGLGESDRICPPADSVRSITVGSIAHAEVATSRVRVGEPSPFTRRGPGGGFHLKPELSSWGGNCDINGNYAQTGVLSVDGGGHIAESIGTSFACPLVASPSANVWRELTTQGYEPTPTLVKGLQMHSAFMKNMPHEYETVKYIGLGAPVDVSEVVNCAQSAATIIFQVPVLANPIFDRRQFPMPKCLNGPNGLSAEVIMTLCYDPPLDRRFNAEYCRSNVTAALGTTRFIAAHTDNDGKLVKAHWEFSREIEPAIKVAEDAPETLESALVEHGFKWSPVKFYYRKFERGPIDKEWVLKLRLLHRSGYESSAAQLVYVIITVRDPKGTAPVYNEIVQEMNRLGWVTQDLAIRSRGQERGRP